MKIKILFAGLLTLASFTAGYAQALDKAKLDQFFNTGQGAQEQAAVIEETDGIFRTTEQELQPEQNPPAEAEKENESD